MSYDLPTMGSANGIRHAGSGTEAETAEHPARPLLDDRARFLEFLERRTGSRALAEDILQDAYVKAFERAGQVRSEQAIIPWFLQILRNAIVDRARRMQSESRALELLAKEVTELDEPIVSAPTTCKCVHHALGGLKPEYQAPLRAIELDGRTLRAFADENGITPNNAAVRLHRGRAALRKQLEAVCGSCAGRGCLGDCTCERAG